MSRIQVSRFPETPSRSAASADRAADMSQPKRTKGTSRLSRPFRKRQLPSSGQQPPSPEQRGQVTVGSLVIDKQCRSVQVGDQTVRLTPTEFALLWVLATHPGAVYRRDELLEQVWGKGVYVTPRTVDVHMSKLRQKLRLSDDGLSLAETVWGIGYRLRG